MNTPLFNNKGEFQTSVNLGNSGIDPQLAFAIIDHISVMINGSFAPGIVFLKLYQDSLNYMGLFIEPTLTVKFGFKNFN